MAGHADAITRGTATRTRELRSAARIMKMWGRKRHHAGMGASTSSHGVAPTGHILCTDGIEACAANVRSRTGKLGHMEVPVTLTPSQGLFGPCRVPSLLVGKGASDVGVVEKTTTECCTLSSSLRTRIWASRKTFRKELRCRRRVLVQCVPAEHTVEQGQGQTSPKAVAQVGLALDAPVLK